MILLVEALLVAVNLPDMERMRYRELHVPML